MFTYQKKSEAVVNKHSEAGQQSVSDVLAQFRGWARPEPEKDFSKENLLPVQLRPRSSNNPYPTPPEVNLDKYHNTDFGDWGWTAHHIIPVSLLNDVFDMLNKGAQNYVLAITKDDQHREWPAGNIFYGPAAEIRTEPGADSDGFDRDIKYFPGGTSVVKKLEPFYDQFVAAKKEGAAIAKKGRIQQLREVLCSFYRQTCRGVPYLFPEASWRIYTADEYRLIKSRRKATDQKLYYRVANNPAILSNIRITVVRGDVTYTDKRIKLNAISKQHYIYIKFNDPVNSDVIAEAKGLNPNPMTLFSVVPQGYKP